MYFTQGSMEKIYKTELILNISYYVQIPFHQKHLVRIHSYKIEYIQEPTMLNRI